MENLWDGVKGIVIKNDQILVLVNPDDTLDLPGGRVENGETIKSALRREINEETGLKMEIHDPVEKWSFYKTPDQLIKGITFECAYLDGKVKLCDEHKRYFWAAIKSIKRLKFSRLNFGDVHKIITYYPSTNFSFCAAAIFSPRLTVKSRKSRGHPFLG